MTDTTEFDANTGYQLRKIPRGYRYSARLGDVTINRTDPQPRDWEQSLRYSMTIDSTNALLIMKYALVLNYAGAGHKAHEEPRFKLTLFDNKGDTIQDCANYDVYATSGNVKGFQSYSPSGIIGSVRWRDWTTVGANLLKYVGQTITIEFMSADCTQQFHFGYAYFVAECHPLFITVKYCTGDSVASLKAPEGFEKYVWTDPAGVVVDTTQTFSVENPVEGTTYSCNMTSATGCTVELKSTILRYEIKTDFFSTMIDCWNNKVQITNNTSSTHGSLVYNWDFFDGNNSSEKDPQYTFTTSGRHQVRLAVSNPPSTCVDTLTKTIESFSPPLVGITGNQTYCPGLGTWLKAYGAWEYIWNGNLKADSIEVKAPGGQYWLIGHSSTGCYSDTIFKTISEEPDWQFSDQSDTVMCFGESEAILKVDGAATYLWGSGESTNSIVVKAPGAYYVTGTNLRGCKKSKTINVLEYPLPLVEFKTSPLVLNSRHNQLTCQISAQNDVFYNWHMGDGLIETGSIVLHTYTGISNKILYYPISLTATSNYGCTDSSSVIVDVVPFVPNVFSPNGDGINDLFMPDLDLQVMDRNGLILYRGTSGWDGTYQSRLVDPDTYFYLLHNTDRFQKKHTRKGYITLVR